MPNSADCIRLSWSLLTHGIDVETCRTRGRTPPIRRGRSDIAAISPHGTALAAPGRTPTQCGNGHSRSFSFAICQSRASPCGSTIRKKMMSPPNTISSRLEIVLSAMCRFEAAVEEAHGHAQQHRQQRHERAAEERAEHRADAADDHHEQDPERQVEVEGLRLDGAESTRTRTARRRRRNRTSSPRTPAAWRASAGCRSLRPRRPCRARPSTIGRRCRAPCSSRRAPSAATIDSTSRYLAVRRGERVAEDDDLLRGDHARRAVVA